MQSSFFIAAASAALFLGCLKQQPVVQAPVNIDIPPMPQTAQAADVPFTSCWPRLIYTTPAGWDVENKQKESVTLRRRDVADAVITVRVEEAASVETIDAQAEEFHKGIREELQQRGLTVGSYVSILRVIPPGENYDSSKRDEYVIVRYSSEMACGTAAFARPSGPPQRFLVFRGEWQCDLDVENDSIMQTFMQSARVLSE